MAMLTYEFSGEFHDGDTTMDGENQKFFILFSESGVRFFQLCLLKLPETC